MATSSLPRWPLAMVGTLVGLGLGEVLLRARSSTLPSLAALGEADLRWVPGDQSADCQEDRVQRIQAPARWDSGPGWGPSGTDPLVVWFAGDSLTHGSGLAPHAGWWEAVAQGLVTTTTRPVRAVNLSVPGASYCGARMQVEEQAATDPAPDLLLWGVFADDLVQHELLSVGGVPALLPSAAPTALRTLVSRSYLANLAWFTLDRRRVTARGRRIDPAGAARFRAAVQAVAGWAASQEVELLALLLPPAGIASCPEIAAPDHSCAWMVEDLERMHRELVGSGVGVLDLRDRFLAGDLRPIPREIEDVQEGRRDLELHPDETANREIARLTLQELAARGWPPAWTATR